MKQYHENVDFEFLKEMGIKVVMYQPWQIGLFHEELEGKFIWYPKAGTLMYSDMDKNINYKLEGNYCAGGGYPENYTPNATELVYEQITKKAYGER